ncbi:DMT family transporter [Celeribacter sp.]|uniref:DMT family transporter n=1 Tax=Celeribacter sp. TaxID=1890673 RepID=UPI003A8E0204
MTSRAPTALRETDNVRAIGLIILSMALFVVEDLFIKLLSAPLQSAQVMVMFSTGGMVLFALLALARRRAVFAAANWQRLPLIRGACEGIASAGFFTAIVHADLSLVTSILMAMPIVVTAMAAIFLKEPVGLIRWSAVFIGFCGVLLIIRPSNADMPPQALWMLVTVVAIAVRDLLTRFIDTDAAPEVLSFQAYSATLIFGLTILVLSPQVIVAPSPAQLGMWITGVTFGALGYLAIVTSMRIGEPSAVTPFRYVRLVFALIIGAVFLGERPDLATLLGALLIVGAGTAITLRERRLNKAKRPLDPIKH